MKILHIVCFKWNSSSQECIQDNTSRPQISLESLVSLIFDDLRGNVSRSSTLLLHDLSLFDDLGNSKICYLHLALSIEKNVVQLDIPVQDGF